MTDYEHTPVTVDGKTAVVIGGTSGIGEAIALGFASEGADVVATSRSSERVRDTAAKLRELGAETVERPCDVTDRATLERLRDEVDDELGEVDVLVTSAGAVSRDRVLDVSESEWRRVVDVQLDGVYRAVQTFAREMSGGSVVAISSVAAELAMSHLPAYSAAKGGTDAFVRAAAKELAPDVRVNALSPGFVITPQNAETYAEGTEKRERLDRRTPMKRVADREEMVGAAIYLASDASSFTTGEVIRVDGGFAPSAL
ncbi:SDR family NAD(P)-dependent oxidoreductase [Haloplanus sp. GCM10025708]|uniref:SDR family NAD(P)-dependent oxidoreductase n=1 Tax=Haloferacaceae TaxID=1644056 RepID=UPI0036184631